MFDLEKATETIVYIAHHTHDTMKILKILYDADKYHLRHYGRLLTDDNYVKMEYGPVPSNAYDIIKSVRQEDHTKYAYPLTLEAIQCEGNKSVKPLRQPNLDFLSETDIEALDQSIERIVPMSFDELQAYIYDDVVTSTELNGNISFVKHVNTFENAEEVLEYFDC